MCTVPYIYTSLTQVYQAATAATATTGLLLLLLLLLGCYCCYCCYCCYFQTRLWCGAWVITSMDSSRLALFITKLYHKCSSLWFCYRHRKWSGCKTYSNGYSQFYRKNWSLEIYANCFWLVILRSISTKADVHASALFVGGNSRFKSYEEARA